MKQMGIFLGIGALILMCTTIACGKNTVTVELTENAGNTPIQLVHCVQDITDLGVKDAKAIVDNAPSTVIAGVSLEEAEEIKAMLEEAGGVVTIK